MWRLSRRAMGALCAASPTLFPVGAEAHSDTTGDCTLPLALMHADPCPPPHAVPDSPEHVSSVRIYLSAGSKVRLAEYMTRIGQPQYSADYVVLKDRASRADCAEYLRGNILGHRVAFRLKGMAIGDKFISVSRCMLPC